jgi:hypothetical protein
VNSEIQILSRVIRVLIDARVPPEYHEPVHELLDRAYIADGDLKREPRSQAVKKERG